MEQKWTDEQLLEAHRLARPKFDFNDEARLHVARNCCKWPNLSDLWYHGFPDELRIFALALGILPEGWIKTSDSCSTGFACEIGDLHIAVTLRHYQAGDIIECDNWPEAVRTGRAAEACAIMAAHVELERRRDVVICECSFGPHIERHESPDWQWADAVDVTGSIERTT